ncbi:CoA-binding domain protein [Rhizoctonia solani]|uniref:CoA-binding domain protein n=1 Tax=Rhizoctonia solani TaxID=456999 RepID=A0A8H8NNP8_9AGAM|nr:CoA-binding domain protein [Rhizoctonia solani]QRW15873.1 CoA-binding domain protein [Rhizoctonia solani]
MRVSIQPSDWTIKLTISRAPALIGLGILGVTAWAGFVVYATNQERLASSVTKQVLTQVRASQEIAAELGQGVVAEPTWWMVGQPYVDGALFGTVLGNLSIQTLELQRQGRY